MARPIALEIPPRDPRHELIARLENAPVEHAAALLDAYELLQALHDRHLLQVLRGVVGAGDAIAATVAGAADSPRGAAALRNLVILARMLGSLDPDAVQAVAAAVTETLRGVPQPGMDPPGLLSLLGQFRRRELRRGAALVNRFLETLGAQWNARGSRNSEG